MRQHKRKVAIGDVKRGMYVVELDRPWDEVPFEAPFQIQGFTIRTASDLERVSKFCDFVYIDPDVGVSADNYLDKEEPDTSREVYERLFGEAPDLSEPVYEDRLTVEEEIALSREIVEDTRQVYEGVLQDLKAGKTIDTKEVKKTVGSLVESVIRNPDAAALLIRLKQKDSYTYSQAMAVCVTGLAMGRHVGLPERELNTLGTSLLLQDVGKIQLPQSLLMKTEKLSPRERHLLQLHVDASVTMLRAKSELDSEAIEIIRSHHERYDGSGYPEGISGADIPLAASVAGVVDTYVAMTSERPYRESKTPFEVLMSLYNERDKLFPAAVVETFIRCIGIFPVGSFVQLDSGEVGIVVSRNNFAQLKPRIMLILDSAGSRLKQTRSLDLARQNKGDQQYKIRGVVDPSDYNLNTDEFFL